MREKPNVGGIQFKTKKELKEYTKNLLHTKGICRIDKTDKDYEFFYNLYLRKPLHKKYISSIIGFEINQNPIHKDCLLYTSPSPRDRTRSRMPSSA